MRKWRICRCRKRAARVRYELTRRSDREAEGARLLSEYAPKGHLGFESLLLRQFLLLPRIPRLPIEHLPSKGMRTRRVRFAVYRQMPTANSKGQGVAKRLSKRSRSDVLRKLDASESLPLRQSAQDHLHCAIGSILIDPYEPSLKKPSGSTAFALSHQSVPSVIV